MCVSRVCEATNRREILSGILFLYRTHPETGRLEFRLPLTRGAVLGSHDFGIRIPFDWIPFALRPKAGPVAVLTNVI